MRMRFKPYAGPELAATAFYKENPCPLKGKWHTAFARQNQPLHLELGCGKGGFLAQLAARNQTINYLGVDLTEKVLVLAKRNIEAVYAAQNKTPDNVQITAHDIERIFDFIAPADPVQRIYINFCNPWNKKPGHKKHRLTHTKQLLSYREFLADDGEIYFKCDEDELFETTLTEYLPAAGFTVEWVTRDLHADEPAWNIRTEHEQMFTEKGIPTKALIARKGPAPRLSRAEAVAMGRKEGKGEPQK